MRSVSSLGRIETITCAAVALALGSLISSGCTVYQTAPGVYAPASPSIFDRAWEAARGAAYDEGVTVTSEDRSRGVITGRKGAFDVNMSLITQADGSVRVSIKTRGVEAQDPTLNQRLTAAYNRRMGQ
ncbi:MAG: hypothetical protein ABW205_03480 [Burkholderiales bacterium]